MVPSSGVTFFWQDAWLLPPWLALLALSLTAGPLGVLLVLRRLSLMGDALSHAMLPGVALAYFVAGPSLVALSLGGLAAGVTVALAAGWASRNTNLFEDATLAGFQLTALATGVALLSARGTPLDLMHLLFGSVLALGTAESLVIAGLSLIVMLALFCARRAIAFEWFDPLAFRRLAPRASMLTHYGVLLALVLVLVAAFQALGVLLALTLLMLPALTARLWAVRLMPMMGLAAGLGVMASTLGLQVSLWWDLPPGPAVAAVLSAIYLPSLWFAPQGLWRRRHPPAKHRVE